jgi:hypothetical protein
MWWRKKPENQLNSEGRTSEDNAPYRWNNDPGNTDYQVDERDYWRQQVRTSWAQAIAALANVSVGLAALAAASYAAFIAGAAFIQAHRQADAAVEANTVVQRPFVTFNGLQINQQNLLTPGMPYLWFTVLAQNSGNTPTKGMKYVVETSGGQPLDPEKAYQKPLGGALWRITLPPHFNGPLGFPANGIPLSAFKKMVEQHQSYYVYGATHYWDRFAEAKEHISKFCYAVGALISDSNQPAYEPCRFWNCADEDCDADQAEYEAELHKLNSR